MKPLIGAGAPASTATDDDQALIGRLTTLAPALDGEPDPDWQAGTRARLVAMAAVRTPGPAHVPPLRRLLARREGRRTPWRSRLTAGLAGAAVAVTGAAAVVSLSADARPGDTLYGFKRGTEQTQLALAGDARGRTLLGFASTRLEELSAVLPDDPSPDLVADTLATMDGQTADGAAWLAQRALDTGTSAPLDELSGWSDAQSEGLTAVRGEVPAAAAGDVVNSALLLARIDDRVDALRVALDCPSGPATDGSDALGPVPLPCAPPAPPATGGEPDAPGTEQPATSAAPTSGSTSGGSSGSASASGSESGARSGSDSGSKGPVVPGVPNVDPTSPGLPVPDLPTLVPGPDGDVRPHGLPRGSAGAGSAPSSAGRATVPDVRVCLPPLPVVGDC